MDYSQPPVINITNKNVQKGCGSGCGTGCLTAIGIFVVLAVIGALLHNIGALIAVGLLVTAAFVFLTPRGRKWQDEVKARYRNNEPNSYHPPYRIHDETTPDEQNEDNHE